MDEVVRCRSMYEVVVPLWSVMLYSLFVLGIGGESTGAIRVAIVCGYSTRMMMCTMVGNVETRGSLDHNRGLQLMREGERILTLCRVNRPRRIRRIICISIGCC